jgi:hypothetical protein
MYIDQWKALSDRIGGLAQSVQLHKAHHRDSFGRVPYLRQKVAATLSDLRTFRDRFQHVLPPAGLTTIDVILKISGDLISMATNATQEIREDAVFDALFRLSDFTSEMSSILADVQWPLRALSERAFSHLQRLIVVDRDIREKWRGAFKISEVECEKLGGVHLLWHGILAFKVSATGGRTDLVFQQPIANLTNDQKHAAGLVLTEWKTANSKEQALQKYQEAREQAKLYASEILGGTELTAYRYAIVVSLHGVEVPDPLKQGGVEYRHINIAIDLSWPSQRARQRRTRSASIYPKGGKLTGVAGAGSAPHSVLPDRDAA